MKKKISILSKISLILIRIYQKYLSKFTGSNCRFYPTCSSYAVKAINTHGFFKGWYFIIIRICKCHPFGSSGVDLVPEKTNNNPKSRKTKSD